MTKKSKSGEKEVDLIPMIRKVSVTSPEDGKIRICATLRAGNVEHLNPELLITAAKEKCGILSGDPIKESYSILRTHVYLDDAVTEFQ